MNTLDEYWAHIQPIAGLVSSSGKPDAVQPLFYFGAMASHTLIGNILGSDTLTNQEMVDAIKALKADIDEFHVRLGEKAVKLKEEMDKPKAAPNRKLTMFKGIIAACGVWGLANVWLSQINPAAPLFMLAGIVAHWLAVGAGNYVSFGKFKKP